MIDDDRITTEIVLQCLERKPGATICPSEVARTLSPDDATRRALMPTVRRVAATLVREGRIGAMHMGARVDIETARGPFRLALCVARSSCTRL